MTKKSTEAVPQIDAIRFLKWLGEQAVLCDSMKIDSAIKGNYIDAYENSVEQGVYECLIDMITHPDKYGPEWIRKTAEKDDTEEGTLWSKQ